MIGWLEDLSVFYLYVAAVGLFAFAANGMLRFSEWRYRNRAADKLVFSKLRVVPTSLDRNKMDSIRFGIYLSNKSDFPIQYEVINFATSFGGTYSDKKPYKKTIYKISPHCDGWFDDYNIEIKKDLDGTEQGTVKYDLKYGKLGGRLNCDLKQEKRVFFGFDENLKINAIEWIDE